MYGQRNKNNDPCFLPNYFVNFYKMLVFRFLTRFIYLFMYLLNFGSEKRRKKWPLNQIRDSLLLSFAFLLISSYLSFLHLRLVIHATQRLSSPPSVFTHVSHPPTHSRPMTRSFIPSFQLSLICHAHNSISHPAISFPYRRLRTQKIPLSLRRLSKAVKFQHKVWLSVGSPAVLYRCFHAHCAFWFANCVFPTFLRSRCVILSTQAHP